jgi:hypothetical protein
LITERVFTAPLVNPATGRSSRSFGFAGKVDAYDPEAHTLIEYKTGSDLERTKARVLVGSQDAAYAVLLRAAGHDPREAVYRFIVAPRVSLKEKQTPEEYLDECVAFMEPGWVGKRGGRHKTPVTLARALTTIARVSISKRASLATAA